MNTNDPAGPSPAPPGVGYGLSSGWEHEQERLALLERMRDGQTTGRLVALGVGSGSRCLELGAGGGSIARWLCRQVGGAGTVTATDLDTRWLDELAEPNLTVVRHDLLVDELPASSFDFIHARSVLEHIADRERVLERIGGWLAPGGWLYLEDCVAFTVQETHCAVYAKAMRAWVEILARTGTDYAWARTFPRPLLRSGLERVGAEIDVPILRGGSPVAEFWSLTLEFLGTRILEAGLACEAELDAFHALLGDDSFWELSPGFIGAWGRRPLARTR